MRSANAPTISAGVMIAKVSWNIENTVSGMVPFSVSSVMPAMERLVETADEAADVVAKGQEYR